MMLPCACVKAQPEDQSSTPGDDPDAATVWFTDQISPQAVMDIYAKLAGELDGKIAIKLHFGEEGNQNFLPASLIKDLCLKLDATLVETNVLYGGPRSKTASHIALARKHGFDFAPIDILDDEANLAFEAQGRHFSKVYTGSHFTDYDGYLIFSHVKATVMPASAVPSKTSPWAWPAGKANAFSIRVTIRCMTARNASPVESA